MKQDNNTLTTAIEWYDDLSHEDRKGLSLKHFNRLDWHHLTDEQVLGMYNWEHPEQSLLSKEETIKEQSSNRGEGFMGAKWYLIPTSFKPLRELRDIIIAEMDINVTNELKEENTRLKERIEVLEGALKPFSEMWGELTEEKVRQGGIVYQYNNSKITVADLYYAYNSLNPNR